MALLSPRSKVLNASMKNFHKEINKIPDYNQFTETSRPDFIRKDKIKIADKYEPELLGMIEHNEKELQFFNQSIDNIRTGDLKKETYSSSSARQTATNEYLSAVQIVNMKPNNIREIIIDATKQGRNEFVYSLINLMNGSKPGQARETRIEYAKNFADQYFGIKELQDKSNQAKVYISEASDYLNLLKTDLDGFEKRAKAITKSDEMIEENKQFNPARVEI